MVAEFARTPMSCEFFRWFYNGGSDSIQPRSATQGNTMMIEGDWNAPDLPYGAKDDGNNDIPEEALLATDGNADVATVDEAILQELANLRSPKATWNKVLLVVAVSLVLFFTTGLLASPVIDLVMLVGVLLIHEMGHFVGMRLFGYQNVRMFFIPFFGAAVSGRKTGVEGYKEAIVVLLGPVPGLCFSLVLILSWEVTQIDVLRQLAIWFAVINAFNLLPIFPMDGGRLLQIVLFSRNRYVESFINVLAAVALILIGWELGEWILGALGGFMLLGIAPTFKANAIAGQMRVEFPPDTMRADDEIPLPIVALIVRRIEEAFSTTHKPKVHASWVLHVWERMHANPPSLPTSFCLLIVYGSVLLATVLVPLILMIAFGWIDPPQ